MKKISNIEYFNVVEISERFLKNKTEEEIRVLFEEGKVIGRKIENEWYADKKAIDYYFTLFMNERHFTIGPLEINLNNIRMEGRILDIGGGGEGVIGQFKGQQVIVIDPSKRELEEAPESKALNIIMDGTDLKFLDNTFESVTTFFTLMYIPLKDHKQIFKEIHRVLKKNGEFFLWDLIIPKRKNRKEEVYIIALKVKLNKNIIDTAYGVRWEKEQNANYFLKLGKDVGFEVIEENLEENNFYIKFKKI
ncbi:MAG: class I SAM-dependent methyltransferase [Promethearchaeota archaeon]